MLGLGQTARVDDATVCASGGISQLDGLAAHHTDRQAVGVLVVQQHLLLHARRHRIARASEDASVTASPAVKPVKLPYAVLLVTRLIFFQALASPAAWRMFRACASCSEAFLSNVFACLIRRLAEAAHIRLAAMRFRAVSGFRPMVCVVAPNVPVMRADGGGS